MNVVESTGAIAGKPAPTGIVQAVQDPHFKQRSLWEQACQQLGLSVLLTVSLSACTVGPDFHKPEATQIADWAKPARSAPSQAVSEPLNERWWDVFHDAQLSALTQRAMTEQPRPATGQQSPATKPRCPPGDHCGSLSEHRRHRQLRAQTQQRRRPE